MYFRLFVFVNHFFNCESYIFKMQAPVNTINIQEYGSYEIIDDKVRGPPSTVQHGPRMTSSFKSQSIILSRRSSFRWQMVLG